MMMKTMTAMMMMMIEVVVVVVVAVVVVVVVVTIIIIIILMMTITTMTLKSTTQNCFYKLLTAHRFVGLVVRRPPRGRKIPGSNPGCAGIFSGSSHTSDSKLGTPVATLPGAWRYRVSVGTGQPGVSILCLGEVASLICNFYLSVAAR